MEIIYLAIDVVYLLFLISALAAGAYVFFEFLKKEQEFEINDSLYFSSKQDLIEIMKGIDDLKKELKDIKNHIKNEK